MNRLKKRLIYTGFLVLFPILSSLSFGLLENHETVATAGYQIPFQDSLAPLIYIVFGMSIIFWEKVFRHHANRKLGWSLVILLFLLFFLALTRTFYIPNSIPAFLIWIGSIIMTIVLKF